MYIMVIEDEAAERELLATLLQQDGHDVVTAGTLLEAQTILAEASTRVDALIVDLELPDATGTEAVSSVVHAAPGAAVLVFSGHGEDVLQDCLAMGADDVIEKPARLAVIRHALLVGRTQRERSRRKTTAALRAMVDLVAARLETETAGAPA